MRKAEIGVWCGTVLLALCASSRMAWGQAADPEDAMIDTIRDLNTISAADQTRIGEWAKAQIDKLAATPPAEKQAALNRFTTRFQTQFTNPRNSAAFRTQFATQVAQVAASEFGKTALDGITAWGLARVLVDLEVPETFVGLTACLKSSAPVARYLCARGLALQREAIAKDKAKLGEAIQALHAAALAETDPVALSHLYRALAYSGQVGEVFSAYLSIFDKRLSARRKAPRLAGDGAELEAFEFSRIPSVAGALNAEQKSQLAQRVAVFLRLDGERYNTDVLPAREKAKLESTLESAEAVLMALTGGKSAGIAEELAKGGHERRAAVLTQVYRWVGHPTTGETGALNASPWNVPLGAP